MHCKSKAELGALLSMTTHTGDFYTFYQIFYQLLLLVDLCGSRRQMFASTCLIASVKTADFSFWKLSRIMMYVTTGLYWSSLYIICKANNQGWENHSQSYSPGNQLACTLRALCICRQLIRQKKSISLLELILKLALSTSHAFKMKAEESMTAPLLSVTGCSVRPTTSDAAGCSSGSLACLFFSRVFPFNYTCSSPSSPLNAILTETDRAATGAVLRDLLAAAAESSPGPPGMLSSHQLTSDPWLVTGFWSYCQPAAAQL